MLRVNDQDTGVHLGQVDEIHILDLIELEGEPLLCRLEKIGVLSLGCMRFPLKGYAYAVGNWCWDRATIHGRHLPVLLRELMNSRWDCIEAESSIFEIWQGGEVPTWEQLAPLIS